MSNTGQPKSAWTWVKRLSGIRGRLMALAVIAMLPLVFDRVLDVNADRAERIEAAAKQARQLAQDSADQQNEVFAMTRTYLQVVARSYTNFAASAEACTRFLGSVATGLPWSRAISVVNPQGRIVCSSNRSSVGLDLSDRPHFQQAVRTGSFVVSDYLNPRRFPQPSLFATYPERSADGTLEHVTIMVMDTDWIRQRINATAERSQSLVMMVDGAGTVIARQPEATAEVGRNFGDHPLIRKILSEPDGTVTSEGLDGVRRVHGFTRLPNIETRLVVGLDEKDILQRVNRAMWNSYAHLALVTGIVLFGIWYGGERLFVRPLKLLTKTAKSYGRGELQTRMDDKPWPAEIAPLATALETMAGQLAAREQELRTTNDLLEELAQLDGLTGLPNRRTFDARLKTEWQRGAADGHPLGLLMIDLDHFKRLNDQDGHLAGDACLKTVAKVLAAATGSDLAARFGGEEFTVLLPGADTAVAMTIAHRLRIAIEDLRLPNVAAPAGHVTVSIGVASMGPQTGTSPQPLVEAADAALYEAKRQGRNRAVAAGHPPVPLAAVG